MRPEKPAAKQIQLLEQLLFGYAKNNQENHKVEKDEKDRQH